MHSPDALKHHAVLFVCMGNICRSPTAEGVLRTLQARLAPELKLRIDSAGTHAHYHLGEQPDHRSQTAALKRGYDISAHNARIVMPEDFSEFDYVLAMDQGNLSHLRKMRHTSNRAKLGLLLDYAGDKTPASVPDPYNEGPAGFERVLDLVEQGVLGLLQELCRAQAIRLPDSVFGKQNARH
ncbi:MAG: low molecular weight protein-tyrosine-phosphatase [Gammaproteobacteria bacterium]